MRKEQNNFEFNFTFEVRITEKFPISRELRREEIRQGEIKITEASASSIRRGMKKSQETRVTRREKKRTTEELNFPFNFPRD